MGLFWQELGATLPLVPSWAAAPSPSGELREGGKLGEVVLAQLPAGSSPGSLQPAMDACLSVDPQPKPLESSLAELVPSISGELKEVLWRRGESTTFWINSAFQVSISLGNGTLPGWHPLHSSGN